MKIRSGRVVPSLQRRFSLTKNNSRRVIPSEFEDWRRSTSIKTNVIGIWHYISYTCNSKTISTKEQHVGTSSLLLIIVEGANIFFSPLLQIFLPWCTVVQARLFIILRLEFNSKQVLRTLNKCKSQIFVKFGKRNIEKNIAKTKLESYVFWKININAQSVLNEGLA